MLISHSFEEVSTQDISNVEACGQAKRRGAPAHQNPVLIRRSEIGKLEGEIELLFYALMLPVHPGDGKGSRKNASVQCKETCKEITDGRKIDTYAPAISFGERHCTAAELLCRWHEV